MRIVKALLPFLSIAVLFVITGFILVMITDKEALHLSINATTGGAADDFFAIYTHVGDGISVPIIMLVACIIYRKNFVANALLGLTTFALSGLITQFFKRVVFSDIMRPSAVLEGKLHLVDNVKLHSAYSFPSGHSTVSFALFIFLAFLFNKRRSVQALFAIMAVFAAYSRVHISQHFVEDIIAGAVVGILSFFLFHWIFNKFLFKEKLNP